MTAARLVLALLAADPAPTLEESAQRVVDAANRVVTAADALAARPSTEPACDQVHPAQFTSVRELREGNDAISLFAPGDAGVACRQNETAGRWVIGERSEIDFTFDYRSVEQRVSHLGRIDVSGRIISKDTVRPIEIPGYQEIGAPTFAVSQQTIEEEGLVAAFAEISAIATAIGDCKSNLAGCPGDWYGEWFFTELFQNSGHYSELFTRILARSDGLISPRNNADVSAAALRKVILLARMGQEVLLTREATVTELGRSIAKAEDALDLARFNASYEWLQATVPDPMKDKQYCVPLSAVRPTVTCKREQLRAVCERLVAAWQLRCTTQTAPGNLSVLAEDQHTVAATLAVVSAARIAELKLLSPSELMDEAVWLIRRDEGFASAVNRPLSKADPTIDALVPDVPVLAAMYAQFEDLNRELKATRGAPDLLRAQLKRLRGQGWLEVRLQPKALGAKEGDVIELTLSYLPPGSSSNPTNVNVPTDGQLRPARWVLRFIINRVGFYLQAGAKLSLVWSQDYAPTAASFRGAQGVLVPGVGFDLMYYAGENMHVALRTLLFAFSGLSLRADYLDFDTGQSVEIGLGAHLNFFKGIVSFGVGYNFGIPNPRFTFREVYWSFGLGVEQMLDLAKTLADTYTR